MSDHPLTSLEAALSVDPIYSETLEFELRGSPVRIRFRELSQDRIDKLRRLAIEHVEQDRRRKESEEWRNIQVDMDAMRANELDLRMIHYCMIDADAYDEDRTVRLAVENIQLLRDGLSPDIQEHLAAQHKLFCESISPDSMAKEDIEELADLIKKKEIHPLSASIQFGFKTLIASFTYLVDELATYQTELSSDTPSGE